MDAHSNVRLMSESPAHETKARILDEAETLFAERGIAASSLRDLTARAGVNLAAVHYHFGSKQQLVAAVFHRRMDPLNARRMELLDAAVARGHGTPSLRDVVHAMVSPALRLGRDQGQAVLRLMGRLHHEPPAQAAELVLNLFRDLRDRFVDATRRAAPHLDATSLFLRMHFLIGAMAHAMCSSGTLSALSEGQVDDSLERMEAELLHFAVAGLTAPPCPYPSPETRPADVRR